MYIKIVIYGYKYEFSLFLFFNVVPLLFNENENKQFTAVDTVCSNFLSEKCRHKLVGLSEKLAIKLSQKCSKSNFGYFLKILNFFFNFYFRKSKDFI